MDIEEEKRQLMARKLEFYEGGDLHEGECPGCGWHVSSHRISQYGLDCPPSMTPSPAAQQRRLPSRK